MKKSTKFIFLAGAIILAVAATSLIQAFVNEKTNVKAKLKYDTNVSISMEYPMTETPVVFVGEDNFTYKGFVLPCFIDRKVFVVVNKKCIAGICKDVELYANDTQTNTIGLHGDLTPRQGYEKIVTLKKEKQNYSEYYIDTIAQTQPSIFLHKDSNVELFPSRYGRSQDITIEVERHMLELYHQMQMIADLNESDTKEKQMSNILIKK